MRIIFQGAVIKNEAHSFIYDGVPNFMGLTARKWVETKSVIVANEVD